MQNPRKHMLPFGEVHYTVERYFASHIFLSWFLEAMKLQLEAEEARSENKYGNGGDDIKDAGIREVGKLGDADEMLVESRSLGACRLYSLSPSSLKSLLYRTLCSDSVEHIHDSQKPWRCNAPPSRERGFAYLCLFL